ncbi:sugar phosphate isomerase/epimerase family protein [Bythopirellula polymerisocia]|uniref:Xylose isomerase-like TIM barrel n=1 Tax=Bythopirellula polymerisocia TaxID=2528003 RepID=A0A5C6C6T3_9BACT|nr:sugar phosphate isomerase/epimerase family protein [Bythopirellula polymerisocia]TWU20343.1 Xylose isomerase-like TIM barrel [Bythopirellula polymerisocia]
MPHVTNRRDFLSRWSVMPLIAAGGFGLTSQVASAQSTVQRVGGSKLKLSLNAYSFSKALNDHIKGRGPGMTLFDMLDFCAEQDFDAVDPTGYFFPGYPAVPTDKFINDFKRRAFQLGLDISGTGIRNDFCTPDKAARAKDVQHIKEWIEVSAKLGAPVIRVFATNQRSGKPEGYSWDEVASWMADDIRECADHGEKYGVIVGVQHHTYFLKTTDQMIKLLQLVDSPWCGLIVDTGCFLSADPYAEIETVLPYAVNFQIKEKLYGQESDTRVDLVKLFQIIQDSGYRGYIPIETLYLKNEVYDPEVRTKSFLKEVRLALAKTKESPPVASNDTRKSDHSEKL